MMTKQKGFVAALLMTTAFTPLRADAACTPTPDCAELGYTQTLDECPDNAVKCPWDTNKVFCYGGCDKEYKYTCTGENETAGLCKCGGKYISCGCTIGYQWENGCCSRPKCKIGDIFYADYTCTTAINYDDTKEVLGIVVYVNPDGVGGQIMVPWPIDANGFKTSSNSSEILWSTEKVDIAGITNYTSAEAASMDYNSCSNTDAIVKQGDANTYPAAWAARKYAPNMATKGKWCLPAAGILTNIYNNQSTIQTAISKVGGVTDIYSWSSSEYNNDYGYALTRNFVGSYGLYDIRKDNHYWVRPVLEF